MASKGTIGGKIVLEGEQAYRQALKNIKSAQNELRSEMKLSQSQFKESANSLAALTSKQDILTKQVDVSQKKVDVYAQAVADSTKKQEEAKKALDALKASQNASDEELAKAQKDYDNASNTLNKYQTNLNYAEAELNEMKSELSKTNAYLNEASNNVNGCANSIDKFGNEVRESKDETSIFGDVLKANLTSAAIIDGIKTLANGIKDIASSAIETGMQFEASMDKVAALSGATGEDLEKLTELAKEMGATTMYSASEAADALSYMALAGWDTQSMLKGLNPVLNLAAASGMDLATTSDIVTDYLTAFRLSAEDAAKFTDQLAYAMAHSNTNVNQLGEAYKNAASTAASLGFSVEDVTAVLMTMANAGVKGGEAGTGLSTIMTRLATNTKGCATELEKYGIEVYDAEGNMNDLSTILEGLGGMWGTLNQQQQASLAKMIAGQSQYSKFQTIMNGVSDSAKEGGQSFYDYAKALKECEGSASEMADVMQDNLKGKITILDSALDALKNSTYEVFDDALKKGVDGATNAVTRLNNSVSSGKMNVSLNKMADALDSFLDSAISVGEKGLPVIIDGLAWVMEHADYIAVGIGGIVAAQAAMGIVSGIQTAVMAWQAYKTANEGATIAQWLLNAAMDANPIGAMVIAIEAAVAALGLFIYWLGEVGYEESELTKETNDYIETAKSNLDVINDEIDARREARGELESSCEATDNLIGRLEELNEKTALSVSEQAEMQSIVEQLNQQYPDLNLQLDKNGKLVETTTAEIREQCNAYKELFKVQAAQADMEAIAKNLYDAEKQLAEIEKKRVPIEAEIEKQAKELGMTFDEYVETLVAVARTTDQAMEEINDNVAAWIDLNTQMVEAEGTIDVLNDEYAEASRYVSENSDVIDENSDAIEEDADAFETLKEALGETADGYSNLSTESKLKLADLADAVESSVESSLNAFEKFKNGTRVSKEELMGNLDSQIEGIRRWSTDMQELANRGISQGLLEELAKMGPEGYTYVEAFLSMTDEELKDYDEKFQSYVELPEQTKQDIIGSYKDIGKEVAKAIQKGLKEEQGNTRKALEGQFNHDLLNPPKRMIAGASSVSSAMAEAMADVSNVIGNASFDSSTLTATIEANVQLSNSSSTNAMLSLLNEYLPALANMSIMLDGNILVGQTASRMDSELGRIAMINERGVV